MFSRVFCIGKGVKFAPFCLCKYGFLRVSFKMRNEKKKPVRISDILN